MYIVRAIQLCYLTHLNPFSFSSADLLAGMVTLSLSTHPFSHASSHHHHLHSFFSTLGTSWWRHVQTLDKLNTHTLVLLWVIIYIVSLSSSSARHEWYLPVCRQNDKERSNKSYQSVCSCNGNNTTTKGPSQQRGGSYHWQKMGQIVCCSIM